MGGKGCTVHGGRGFTTPPSPAQWLWRERGEVRIRIKHRGDNVAAAGHRGLLSCVGRGFFSCVSVFFSLDLSKLATSETSGLSLIVADLQEQAGKREFPERYATTRIHCLTHPPTVNRLGGSQQIRASTIAPFPHAQLHSFVPLDASRLPSTPLPNPDAHGATAASVEGLLQTMGPVPASKPRHLHNNRCPPCWAGDRGNGASFHPKCN